MNNLYDSRDLWSVIPPNAGELEVTHRLLDYPTFKLSEFSNSKVPNRSIGSIITLDGLDFYISSISCSYLEDSYLLGVTLPSNLSFKYLIVYEGFHIGKKLAEYPINVRDLVTNGYGKSLGTGYSIMLKEIYQYALSTSNIPASFVGIPNFTIYLTAEGNEYVSLSDYLTDARHIKGLAFQFIGNTVHLVPLVDSAGGGVGINYVGNVEYVYSDNFNCYSKTLLEKNNYPEYTREYITLDNVTYYTYEGDENPHVPPLELSDLPKTSSIMYGDSNAITKNFKITVYDQGGIKEVYEGVFGYAHALVELTGGNVDIPYDHLSLNKLIQRLIGTNPQLGDTYVNLLSFVYNLTDASTAGYEKSISPWINPIVWRCVKLTKSTYFYRNLTFDSNLFSIYNDDGTTSPIVINPNLSNLLLSSYSVLERIVTEGIELRRFNSESTSSRLQNDSLNAKLQLEIIAKLIDDAIASGSQASEILIAAWITRRFNLESFLYRRVPIIEARDFGYAPYSKFYKDQEYTEQFQTIFVRASDLGIGGNEFKALIVPSPDFKPSLMITSEHFYSRSIATQGNPGWQPFNRNYFQSNPLFVYTGSEVETIISYTPIPSFNTTNFVNDYNFNTNIPSLINSANIPLGTYYSFNGISSLFANTTDGFIQGGMPNISMAIPGTPSNKPFKPDTNDLYIENIKTRTAQNMNYKDGKTFKISNIKSGRPPEVTLRKSPIDLRENRDPSYSPDFFTYITSNIQSPNILRTYGNNLSNRLQDLIDSARNAMVQDILVNGSKLKFSVLPTNLIKVGDYIRASVPGKWIVIEVTKKSTKLPNVGLETNVVCGDLKSITISHNTVNKVNRSAKYSSYERSGKIKIDLSNNYERQAVDLTSIFAQQGFGRYLQPNQPAKISPIALFNSLKL